MTSRPVLIIFSVLAGLQVLAGAAALSDAIGDTAFGLFSITVAAVQAGMTFYVQGVVTPNAHVAAYLNTKNSTTEAGPAAPIETGTPVVVQPDVPDVLGTH